MPYINSGYVATGYYEGDTVVGTPTSTIVEITRSFVLDGVDVTKYVKTAEVSRENRKAFTTLTASIAGYEIPVSLIRNKDKFLVVTIGLTVYDFILFDVDTDYKNNSEIIAKTQGCLLDYPFYVKKNESIIGSGNEVIAQLANPIATNITLPDFEFNQGSFITENSALEALDQLVSVSGGTYFEVGSNLIFTEHLYIDNAVPKFIFNDNILTSKTLSDNFSGSPLVQTVVFNANDDLSSEPLITMVTPDDCTRPYFLLNPTPTNIADITSNLGTMLLTFTEELVQETISANFIQVAGGIHQVKQITLDGEPLLDTSYQYEQGYNIILFTGLITGTITITYETLCIARYQYNGVFDFESVSNIYYMRYLNQELNASNPICAEVVSSDGLNNFSIELVGLGITLDYPTQFDVIGTVNQIAFISNQSATPTTVNTYKAYGSFDTTFMQTISYEDGVIAEKTFSATIENVTANVPTATGEIYGFLTSPDININECIVGSLNVYLDKYVTDDYFVYYTTNSDFIGQSSTSTYTATVRRYTIPAVGATNTVKYIDWYYDGGISTFNYPDASDIGVCILPATIDIDLASELDMPPQNCAGKSFIYKGTTYISNAIGVVSVYLSTYEKVVVDTSHIRKGSYVTIDTTNAG